MMRVRLKADGRLVEILADGSERALPPAPPESDRVIVAPSVAHVRRTSVDAANVPPAGEMPGVAAVFHVPPGRIRALSSASGMVPRSPVSLIH